jgi:hypothetical protein
MSCRLPTVRRRRPSVASVSTGSVGSNILATDQTSCTITTCPYLAKLRLYEILYTLNQGFEQALGQLQQLEKLGLGHQRWKALRVAVEETRAEVNFELSSHSRSAKRGLDLLWPALPRAGEEASRSSPQEVLTEADRLRQQLKKRRAQRRGTDQQ